jgi:hypothetical protein
MAPSASLDAWCVWAAHLKQGRSVHHLSQSLLAHWGYDGGESAFGLLNLRLGLGSPVSGSASNPLFCGPSGIARSLFWGLVFPQQPEKAGEFAFYDASIDHAGEGVWLAVAFACLASIWSPKLTTHEAISFLTSVIPKESGFFSDLPILLKLVGDPEGARQLSIGARCFTDDPGSATTTGLSVLAGLVFGGQKFSDTIRATVAYGGSAEASTLVAGALAGMTLGKIDKEWADPLGEAYVAGSGLKGMDPPKTIDDFCALVSQSVQEKSIVVAVAEVPADPQPSPALEESLETPESEPQETPSEPVVPNEPVVAAKPKPNLGNLTQLLSCQANWTMVEVGDILVKVTYLESPYATLGIPFKLQISLSTTKSEPQVVAASISAGSDDEVATRITDVRLDPGQETHFPTVIRFKSKITQPRLKVNGLELLVPLLTADPWMTVGPFVNHDGMGYERSFMPESAQLRSSPFSGRSEMPVRWQESSFNGPVLNVEPLFKLGPGTVYLWRKVRFAKAGQYQIVVSLPTSAIAWADGQRVLWYNGIERLTASPVPPFVGTFSTTGLTTILIKILRGKTPVGPLTVYFLDETGKVVQPLEDVPMEP